MGNFLTQPITTKEIETFEYCGKTGAVVSMQGWRINMEVLFRFIYFICRTLTSPNLFFLGWRIVASLVYLMDMVEPLHLNSGILLLFCFNVIVRSIY